MLLLFLGSAALANGADPMAQKLDPELLALTENQPEAIEAEETIDVLVGLSHALTDVDEAALKAAGLSIRSRIGDVLTGSIAIGDLRALSDVETVLRVDSSRPMAPEISQTE